MNTEEVKMLANKHWNYIRTLLFKYGHEAEDLEEYQFKSGFIHGYKHGKEDKE